MFLYSFNLQTEEKKWGCLKVRVRKFIETEEKYCNLKRIYNFY